MKQAPVRTCLGCGRRLPQAGLVRFSLDAHGVLALDLAGVMPGRGGYCCRTQACIRSFCKSRKRLARAFRREIADGVSLDPLKIEKMLESGSFR